MQEPPAKPPRIVVNGRPRQLDRSLVLSELLAELGLPVGPGVAVERNRVIVPKAAYATTRLDDGDELEIVTLVGGG
ncbi:MAG: sulfur carrier protein ThiS [Planctomycetota bacterium]